MNGQSSKSSPMTCEDTSSATSSLESESGATPSGSQDGQMTASCGPAPARANHSARRVSSKEPQTPATFGLSGSGSSASVALSQSLASRLERRFATVGSILFRQTWRVLTTPSGRQLWAHTASAHRTSGSDCTSWPTPDASVAQDGETFDTWEKRRLRTKARVKNGNGFGTPLTIAAQLASWPTAGASDASGTRKPKNLLATHRPSGAKVCQTLNHAAFLATWTTPSSRDFKSNEGSEEFHAARREQARGKPLSEQAHQLSGQPADWLPCIDGKARPVEPGTFPLAHGATARVGRLRAYGNAIVPQAAAEFIKAAMECLS